MKIEIFPSASGDCLLITSADGKRLLCDAGLPAAYDDFIAAPLSELRQAGKAIDIAYVSHIDQDHIGGILKMLDYETKWRVFEKAGPLNPRLKSPKEPRPPEILELWHNAFLEDVAKTEAVQLGSALTASANALAGLNAAGLGDARMTALSEESEMLALSVGEAIEVNWRIGKDQLDIPLNKDFGGKFMVARPNKPIQLGSLKVTVLGPTAKQLKELRKEWVAWLKRSQDRLETLRRQHQKDIEDLRSGLSPLDIAKRTQALALSVEKDVTPPNLASLVLLLEENGRRVLLTGDAGDVSLLEYLDAAGLLDAKGRIEVDVLKAPHHGAFNSYSASFVDRVRASHYIFCGDGEHHNPEPGVITGYLDAVRARPLGGGRTTNFWFNWSRARAKKHQALWDDVEGQFAALPAAAKIKRRSLAIGEDRMVLDLS